VREFFSSLTVVDTHHDVRRNIVSLRESRNLFDDLSADPAEQAVAQQVESAVKPLHYHSPTPVIHRPFEEVEWFNAIGWPFQHWQSSRYSDGSFGVWYGADSVAATVYETACHWYRGLLLDAEGYADEAVAIERKVYTVACDALLLDLRPRVAEFPALLHSPTTRSRSRWARDCGVRAILGSFRCRRAMPRVSTTSSSTRRRCPTRASTACSPIVSRVSTSSSRSGPA
jgi:hypothetical protein